MRDSQNLEALLRIQSYVDDINLEFESKYLMTFLYIVNESHSKEYRALIEKAASVNCHMHTSLNGQLMVSPSTLVSSSKKLKTQGANDSLNPDLLDSVLNELASNASTDSERTGDGISVKNLMGIYSSINGDMSSVMMVRDDQVEPDIESFRCLNHIVNLRHRDKAGFFWVWCIVEKAGRELQGGETFDSGREPIKQ